MLADLLNKMREHAISEINQRAEALEGPGSSPAGRSQRLSELFDELIAVLQHGGIDEQTSPVVTPVNPALDSEERELMQRYVVEGIEHHEFDATPTESGIVSAWPLGAELRRVRTENQLLRKLLDAVDESTEVLTLDGRFIYVNQHAARALGREYGIAEDQIVGKTPNEIGVPRALGVGRPGDELLTMARSKQKLEMVSWGRATEDQFDAVYALDGDVSAITVVERDVQARKLVEDRLSLLNKLGTLTGSCDYDEVAMALAHIPIPELADWCGINVIHESKIIQTFIAQRDPAKLPLRDALVYALQKWDRHPLWQELLTSGVQLLTEVNNDMLRSLALTDAQYQLILRVGIRSLMLVPIVSRGQIVGIVSFIYTNESGRRYGPEDPALAEEFAVHAAHIIETARLMKELKASESRFRVALAGARTVVFEQDRSLRYIYYYNPMTTSTALGKTPDDLFQPGDAAIVKRMRSGVLERGESAFEEADLTVAGDQRRHYREALEPVRDHAGNIIGLIGAATDITEQQEMQRRLSDALTFRERMMGVLGHDLRNPLSTIIMVHGLLLKRNDLPPDARNQVQRGQHAAERMLEMIDTLLDFTRARLLGTIPITPVPADLARIARGVTDEMRLASLDRSIEVEIDGDPRGEWDPARLSQMISNLEANAIAYGDPHTPVRVVVDGTSAEVVLKVINLGPPIPPEAMPTLFEPFHRGVPDDRSPEGLGLGLYIARQIVQAHGGTIGVESSADLGTAFTVRLPRRPAPPPVGSGVSPQKP